MPKLYYPTEEEHKEYEIRIREWMATTSRLKRWLLWTFKRKDFCPRCEKATKFRFDVLHVLPDDPGLFGRWACKECGLTTGYFPAPWTKKALENLDR
jgi:hypothetical protein